jgi:hypothetical protein
MRNRISLNEPDVINSHQINAYFRDGFHSNIIDEKRSDFEILAEEGYEDFVNYIEWLGLAKDPDLVVLSSVRHYYYDAVEMKNIRTLVNLKELNKIKSVNNFLNCIYEMLPDKSYLVGCFVDNKRMKGYLFRNRPEINHGERTSVAVENGIVSRNPILNLIYSKIDYRTYRYLSKNDVTLLLENPGFKIQDMTDLSGISYFCTQKIS